MGGYMNEQIQMDENRKKLNSHYISEKFTKKKKKNKQKKCSNFPTSVPFKDTTSLGHCIKKSTKIEDDK